MPDRKIIQDLELSRENYTLAVGGKSSPLKHLTNNIVKRAAKAQSVKTECVMQNMIDIKCGFYIKEAQLSCSIEKVRNNVPWKNKA